MSAFKNVSGGELTYEPDGPGSAVKVAPGAVFTLMDSLDYLVGSQIAPGQVEKVDLNAVAEKPSKAKAGAQ